MSDEYETLREASTRLGVEPDWLRHRARSRGYLGRGPVGRPPKGMRVTLSANEWNLSAAPAVRKFVGVGALEKRTGKDWRTVLATARRMKERIYTKVPGERSRYCVSASSAERIVNAFKASTPEWGAVKTVAEACGVHMSTMRRVITQYAVPTRVDATRRSHGQGHAVVNIEAAREALMRDLSAETIAYAAKRHGVDWMLVSRALVKAGVHSRGKSQRKTWFDPRVVDAALAAYRTNPTDKETTPHAAQRSGVPVSTMKRWLASEGVVQTRAMARKAWLDPAIVDAIVNRRRAAAVG